MAIHITSKTKSLRITPKSKDELQSIIKSELKRQGPDADLNFINTSEISDMAWLFNKLDPRNIKIDE
nr:MAG TPA: YajQ-like protein [Caudoviricetes sp.]